jgi:hypothetical protein
MIGYPATFGTWGGHELVLDAVHRWAPAEEASDAGSLHEIEEDTRESYESPIRIYTFSRRSATCLASPGRGRAPRPVTRRAQAQPYQAMSS